MIHKVLTKRTHLQTIDVICLGVVLIIFGFIVHRVWFCDDSFITFRTLENFVNGYQLTWNVYERVQGYSHPLWLFVLIPIYALTKEIYITVTVVSLIFTAIALVLLYRSARCKKSLLISLLILMFSNAFIDYSTSGLENSLLNLVLAIGLSLYFNQDTSKHSTFWFYFVSGLVFLTRIDFFLVLLPAVLFLFISKKQKFWLKLRELVIAFIPVIIWELFSLFYYGFPFPNTFYAKLTAGFPTSGYLIRGIAYLFDAITVDPVTFIGLMLGGFFLLVSKKKNKPVSIGILLYLLYLLFIGGDFMSGRMFSSLLFSSVFLFAQSQEKLNSLKMIGISAVLIIFGFLARCPTPLLATDTPISNTVFTIVDERRVYSLGTGLFREGSIKPYISIDERMCGFCGFQSILDDRVSDRVKLWYPKVIENIGFQGYYSGPEAKLIDAVGLTDAFIARLPAIKDPLWRIGHLIRDIPEGYVRYVADQTNHLRDPDLEEYNQHLAVLIRGSLFAKDRIIEIIRFNLGYYNYLLPVGN